MRQVMGGRRGLLMHVLLQQGLQESPVQGRQLHKAVGGEAGGGRWVGGEGAGVGAGWQWGGLAGVGATRVGRSLSPSGKREHPLDR